MRNLFHCLAAAGIAFGQLALGAPACGGHGDSNSMLVTTAWLADHLHDPNLVIIGVGPEGDYEKGHIPGSQFLQYSDAYLKKSPAGLTTELPPMPYLADLFGKLGVTNDSRIILYPLGEWYSPTTRVYLTLDAMGLGSHTSLLDGGIAAWQSEHRPVTTDVLKMKPGKIDACAQDDVITDLEFVKSHLKQPGVALMDSRSAGSYSAAQPTQNSRAGHVPGAASLPFEVLLDDKGKLKPVKDLEALFSKAGAKKGDRVVAYCYIGQRATMVYFVARYLGYDARLFDGSWEEWNQHIELPTEVSGSK
jgi:thiosulfate/3-mercaptopyruvate sulfurtransferase